MEIVGKIILALPEVSGTSKAGNPWKKREYVLETLDTYPRKVMFNFFNAKADQYALTPGQTIRLTFDLESREFNNRWYTDVRGIDAMPVETNTPPVSNVSADPFQPVAQAATNIPPAPAMEGNAEEDLPF